ncbi:MAG TPA: hypothetical protein VFS13_00780 [Steroidobacteraceae bacterium]|nr:hypothetical protein [Steroidobacteraceae bacterium]
MRELRAQRVTGWDMQAAGGYHVVCFDTETGLQCLAITPDRTATLIDELIALLDKQIRAEAAALH